jgi:thioredoxin-like negative regulator of GroEL
MKKIITFTSEWNSNAKKVIDFLSKKQPAFWESYEFGENRELALSFGVKKSQTYILVEDSTVLASYEGALKEEIFESWIQQIEPKAAPDEFEVVVETEPASEHEDEEFKFEDILELEAEEFEVELEEEILDLDDASDDLGSGEDEA